MPRSPARDFLIAALFLTSPRAGADHPALHRERRTPVPVSLIRTSWHKSRSEEHTSELQSPPPPPVSPSHTPSLSHLPARSPRPPRPAPRPAYACASKLNQNFVA